MLYGDGVPTEYTRAQGNRIIALADTSGSGSPDPKPRLQRRVLQEPPCCSTSVVTSSHDLPALLTATLWSLASPVGQGACSPHANLAASCLKVVSLLCGLSSADRVPLYAPLVAHRAMSCNAYQRSRHGIMMYFSHLYDRIADLHGPEHFTTSSRMRAYGSELHCTVTGSPSHKPQSSCGPGWPASIASYGLSHVC